MQSAQNQKEECDDAYYYYNGYSKYDVVDENVVSIDLNCIKSKMQQVLML